MAQYKLVRPVLNHGSLMQQHLQSVNRKRLHEDIVNEFHELINTGVLVSGQRLPSERDLANQFNVSRSSVREAIRSMELQGLVNIKPGSGTFVSDQNASISDLVSSAIKAKSKQITDIFEIRRLLEPAIAGLAATRASKSDIEDMRNILLRQQIQVENGETGVESDTEFHFALAQSTHNMALVNMVSAISDILSTSRDISLQAPGRPQRSVHSHSQIVNMIESHNSEKAIEAMNHHLAVVEPVPEIANSSFEAKVPEVGGVKLA